jgi:hypothetical protein
MIRCAKRRGLFVRAALVEERWEKGREKTHFNNGIDATLWFCGGAGHCRRFGLEDAQFESVHFENDDGRAADEWLEDAEAVAEKNGCGA